MADHVGKIFTFLIHLVNRLGVSAPHGVVVYVCFVVKVLLKFVLSKDHVPHVDAELSPLRTNFCISLVVSEEESAYEISSQEKATQNLEKRFSHLLKVFNFEMVQLLGALERSLKAVAVFHFELVEEEIFLREGLFFL